MRTRVGDRYIDRPLKELVLEALIAPFFFLAVRHALRGGWSH
jgi:hypothetical protein